MVTKSPKKGTVRTTRTPMAKLAPQVMQMRARGLTVKQIAEKLKRSERYIYEIIRFANTDGDALILEIPDPKKVEDLEPEVAETLAFSEDGFERFFNRADSSPSFTGSAVLGRFIVADGTPKAPEFVIADTKESQGAPKLVYLTKERRYFVVWEDSRNNPPANDIYAKWLDEDGNPIGDDIPIYLGEGSQGMPSVAYSPVSKSFLIAWRDENAENDYEPIGPGAVMAPEIKADVRGVIFGAAQPCPANEIYGGPSREARLLRSFRDNVLSKTAQGRAIIKLYYDWSPAVVKGMKEAVALKEEVKKSLDGVLLMLR